MNTNRGAPTPPIAFPGAGGTVTDHLRRTARRGRRRARASASPRPAPTSSRAGAVVGEASRDWWPLAMIWALDDQVAARAGAVVRPAEVAAVADDPARLQRRRVPVTAAAGRSGVCGASVPAFGGVLLDLTAIAGIVDVDTTSMLVDVLPGTFGDVFEDELRDRHGVTCGHWPQSMALSTVGGWLACRGAGQLSTRYGKIEDIVAGLDVVLADGTVITTGGAPRAAVGPDLTQLFVGSEGTLGVIVGARLRLHPVPAAEGRAAYAFASFAECLDAMRRIMQRGATPAVLRLYDSIEADRCVQDRRRARAARARRGRRAHRRRHDADRRRGVRAAPSRSTSRSSSSGSGTATTCRSSKRSSRAASSSTRWRSREPGGRCPRSTNARPRRSARSSTRSSRPRTRATRTPTAAASTSRSRAGRRPSEREAYYRAVWDAGQRAVLAAGGALSHHHGVGLNRARFVREALGPAFDVLQTVKNALDPNGILNPGKLGLPSPFGADPWPLNGHA